MKPEPLEPPYPESVVDGLTELRKYYGDGRKMTVDTCETCKWEAGFYFADDGSVRYDPGCWCKPWGTTTTASSEGELAAMIAQSPDWIEKQVRDALAWEEHKKAMLNPSWEPLGQQVEERQRRREKIRRQRKNSESQADLFGG